MNQIKCIFCNLESDQVAIRENGYEGKRCPQCKLIYISPRPSLNEIVDLYGHNEAQISAQSHIAADLFKRLYAKHNLKLMRSLITSGSLLEIGAGGGYFLDEARKLGYDPYGLEFNSIQADFVRNQLNIPCQESALSPNVFPGKTFDIVYHCDVISHFFDPIEEFKKMHAVMKDNSYLIFETGNFAEVESKYYQYIPSFQYPDHLFFFSIDNLVDLLDKTRFELIKIHRYSLLPQLVILKLLSNLKKVLKQSFSHKVTSQKSTHDLIDSDNSAGNLTNNSLKNIVKQSGKKIYDYFYRYLNYFLRYKLGSIAGKANRPQTVIVVAKKIPNN